MQSYILADVMRSSIYQNCTPTQRQNINSALAELARGAVIARVYAPVVNPDIDPLVKSLLRINDLVCYISHRRAVELRESLHHTTATPLHVSQMPLEARALRKLMRVCEDIIETVDDVVER